jgi:hypothetical protein
MSISISVDLARINQRRWIGPSGVTFLADSQEILALEVEPTSSRGSMAVNRDKKVNASLETATPLLRHPIQIVWRIRVAFCQSLRPANLIALALVCIEFMVLRTLYGLICYVATT